MATIYPLKLERELYFILRGQPATGHVRLGDIFWMEERGEWACEWSISFINPERTRMYGTDPLDALLRTVDFMTSLIRGSEADGLIVWWKERGDHGGLCFPLTENQSWKRMPPSAPGQSNI